ncbi:hypothetical protein [Galbibacter sp. BG1]
MNPINNFQHENGLVPDGIIGPLTINKIKHSLRIPTNEALAHFIGQCHHESNGFLRLRESLNYSVSGLISTFSFYRKRPNLAFTHGRNWRHKADQETIANNVYLDKNRSEGYKLGNRNWGDGWKYRGNGPIQITGFFNHLQLSKYLAEPEILNNPTIVCNCYYFESAIWFFNEHRIWRYTREVDNDSIEKVTKAINGGINGLEDRIKWTNHYYELINTL